MIVDIAELRRVKQYIDEINKAEFKDIVWMENGEVLTSEQSLLNDYKFTGLSNHYFPMVAGFIDDNFDTVRSTVLGST